MEHKSWKIKINQQIKYIQETFEKTAFYSTIAL